MSQQEQQTLDPSELPGPLSGPDDEPYEPAPAEQAKTPAKATKTKTAEPQQPSSEPTDVELAERYPKQVLWFVDKDTGEKKYLPVPQDVDELVRFLDWTKDKKDPAPFRASYLRPPLARLLYEWSGIPEVVNPAQVLIFAGRGYPTAEGCVAAALEHPKVLELNAEHVRTVPCDDPSSGCKQAGRAGKDSKLVETRATVVLKGATWGKENLHDVKRFSVSHCACPHTTWSDRLQKVSQTRALRTAALPILGISEDLIMPAAEDIIDGEVVDEQKTLGASS